jgi:DnaJ like chaperone protein
LYNTVKNQPTLLVSYFDLLFRIVAADGTFHPAEEAALKRIKEIFHISDNQYEDLKAVYFDDLDKYYKILNCTPESTTEEIKSNYKKLVKDFHPDVIISKGQGLSSRRYYIKRATGGIYRICLKPLP